MAVSDPTFDVPTPTGTLRGVAAFGWDGSAWQPAGRASVGVGTPTGVLRGVAQFPWSGSAWQPAAQAGPSVATPSGVLDGVAVYTWSGSAWVPAGGTTTPSTPTGALRGVAAFTWDGTAWQPAAQAGPSVATPYGVLEGVAMFNWTGAAWAAVGAPSLDLSFMTPGTLDPRITFARGTIGTYFDVAGVMQQAAVGVPRWDYDPVSHALNGLLLEFSATNLLLNSATLGTQSVAVTAQIYTLSFYGTGTITKSGTAAGALVGSGVFPARVSQQFTPTAGTLTLTVTGSVLNAQLEAGGLVTSYIPTTGATATRGFDNCSTPTSGGWFNTAQSTLAAEYMVAQSPNTSALHRDACCISDGNTTNRLCLVGQGASNNAATIFATIAGATTSSATAGTTTAGAVAKLAGAWNGTTGTASMNGGAVVSYSVGMPSGVNVLTMGSSFNGAGFYLNGWVRRVCYWPRALSNAELQQVTT